jgi:Tfp pilus assembly protein PilF
LQPGDLKQVGPYRLPGQLSVPEPDLPDPADEAMRPLGRLVRDVKDPFDLEVHPAIDAGAQSAGLSALPRYVEREHDERLREILGQITQRSTIAVLVGGSSTGKTRACWEAIQALPKRWRVWHPISPSRPEAVLNDLARGRLAPQTVVWLNETEFYLDTPAGEQVAAALRELLRDSACAPLLVLGTLWPEYWSALTKRPGPNEKDSRPQCRALLEAAVTIRVPEQFSDDDLRRLHVAAVADPRLALAEAQSPRKVTQFLAGAFELIKRFELAPPAVQAVIMAAMDARRLGHGPQLAEAFLQEAASGYLDDDAWNMLDDDWFPGALKYAGEHCRGIPGPLTLVRRRPSEQVLAQAQYRLADYLDQYGRADRREQIPPLGFWNAAIHNYDVPKELSALAHAAKERGRYQLAARIFRRAAALGDTRALDHLNYLVVKTGDFTGAEELYQRASDADGVNGLLPLVELRLRTGDSDSAARAAQQVIDTGDPDGLAWLADVYVRTGRNSEGEQLYRRSAQAGDVAALHWLTMFGSEAGDKEGANRLAQQVTRQVIKSVNVDAMLSLASLQMRRGDTVAAKRLYQLAADAGNTKAILWLGVQHMNAKDMVNAELLFQQVADAPDNHALLLLARLREEVGDTSAAERLYQHATDGIGDIDMIWAYDLPLKPKDWSAIKRHVVRRAAAAGNIRAMLDLLDERWRADDFVGTAQLYRRIVDTGDTNALRILGDAWNVNGNVSLAQRLYRRASDGGNYVALIRLAKQLYEEEDLINAQQLYQRALNSGLDTLPDLIKIRDKIGDKLGADLMRRFGVDINGSPAESWNLESLEQ